MPLPSSNDSNNVTEWIFGQDLFYQYYTIFDVENMKIGFIHKALAVTENEKS